MADTSEKYGIKYVIVSPVRDEEQYIQETIRSITHQTIRPVEWIIVNDGSSDNTGQIAETFAQQYPWIRVLNRPDRGRRVPGTGVMEAFYHGYESLHSQDWEYLVKLDGDVGLEPDYFEQCFQRFNEQPDLGMCGGMLYRIRDGVLEREEHPIFHVRGPIKLYRRACWEAIGGLIKAPGWDTVDEVKANMCGWRTRSFLDLKAIHYRPTGAAEGTWRDGVKNGRADYISGYHPLFMLAKCAKRLFQAPYVIGAVSHAYGFVTGYLKRIPQIEDPALICYIRNQQLRRLFFRESIWR